MTDHEHVLETVRPQVILAARYVTRRYHNRQSQTILQHLRVMGTGHGRWRREESLAIGRMKRQEGEALCNRRLELSDDAAMWPDTEVKCARCWEIAARYRLKIEESGYSDAQDEAMREREEETQ